MSVEERTRILVVEDEIITAKAIEKSLRNLGYKVVGIVSLGEEAIERAGRMQPDLILMDIKLKGEIDGVQAAQKIQTRLKVPVVYLTAHSDEETVKRIMHSNSYGCIIKPFKGEDLRDAIERALKLYRSG